MEATANEIANRRSVVVNVAAWIAASGLPITAADLADPEFEATGGWAHLAAAAGRERPFSAQTREQIIAYVAGTEAAKAAAPADPFAGLVA